MLIQPLTGSHDRRGFDCGRVELNDWLAKVARQHQNKGLSKTFVAVQEQAPSAILGYYALTLTEVDTAVLPESHSKRLPRIIPGVRLGRLAVGHQHQAKGLGELLLMNAIERVHAIRAHAGVVGLFIDAIDDQAVGFYRRYGALPFLDDPLKLFLPVG
ncbi:GCN5-like N-acetyltransferase [Thiorhodococcus drewsii AZ1]|uniref:GCN5-like N-acetyltransferase n=1 Tax=Thiorhodococcus drewsii AZ1 TaxID=765913 RepID=G2DYK2_9GAMM|nr:GNAT family N-acetyltransferase [Thiorhodococcus drewsii]EGV32629.1 GCN5-like N-acetyltransferase [Thiorhodococcus drewsii AZ1]